MQRNIPLVFMNGYYPQLEGPLAVLDDNYAGGRVLVEYLYEKGHRDIAGIFKGDDIQGPQRYSGYIEALRDLNLPMDDRRIFWYNTEQKESLLSGAHLDPLLRSMEGCTAVVCYNDEIASRVVSLLLKEGVRIPDEIAVVSFDNSPYSELSVIPITSLSHEEYNVGRMAAEQLVRLFNGHSGTSQLAPWTLIDRKSS